MIYEGSLKNCRIIVRDTKGGTTVADTKITGYDWKNNTVQVSAGSIRYQEYDNVSVLIFGSKGIYEYQGNIRQTNIANEIEIALYKGEEKKGREYRRYEFYTQGEVESIKILNQKIILRKPIQISTINMSADGILFQTHIGSFSKYDEIQMTLQLYEKDLELKCEIVRIENSTIRTAEYGCRILSARKL